MQNIVIDIMNQFGYVGVAILIAIENIFPPIPSEVILTFGGFMTTCTSMNAWLVIVAATVGSLAGAMILYSIGYLVNPEKIARMLSGRVGRTLKLKPEDIGNAQIWFNSKGNLTVFFCRFIPIIRSLISIPAGMAQMPMAKFLLMTTAGTTIWNLVLVWFGVFAGTSWEKVVIYMGTYSEVGKVVIISGLIIGVVSIYVRRKVKESKRK